MKTLITLLLLVACLPAAACDEDCKRTKAEQEHDVDFPGYLNASYCQDTTVNFLLRARKSLEQYRQDKLKTGHKGGMRNIRNYLQQRKQWLMECDNYLLLTGQGRVFDNKETTEKIFAATDRVIDELEQLMRTGGGIHVSSQLAEIAGQRLDSLFAAVDNHRTELQLKGQLVIR